MRNPPSDPRDVIKRAAAGDRAARAVLLDAHGPRVWGLCRRLSPEPEDAYQEIWEKLFNRIDRFKPDGTARLGTWISRVAMHHLIDRQRVRKRQPEIAPLEELTTETASAERRVGARRELEKVEAALTMLSGPHRRVVVAHCMHGLALADIAEDEGVALGTVKARLHRARAELFRRTKRKS